MRTVALTGGFFSMPSLPWPEPHDDVRDFGAFGRAALGGWAAGEMPDKRLQFPVQRQGAVDGSLVDERRAVRTSARDFHMRIVSVGKHGRALAQVKADLAALGRVQLRHLQAQPGIRSKDCRERT
jgi:hypothetical protein